MRDKIIDMSLKLLEEYGLKFSIDKLASELSISKKTIYKLFVTKDQLALQVFQKMGERKRNMAEISFRNDTFLYPDLYEIVRGYMDLMRYNRDEIFNHYSINQTVRNFLRDEISRYAILLEEAMIKLGIRESRLHLIIVEGIILNIYLEENRNNLLLDCLRIVFEGGE